MMKIKIVRIRLSPDRLRIGARDGYCADLPVNQVIEKLGATIEDGGRPRVWL